MTPIRYTKRLAFKLLVAAVLLKLVEGMLSSQL
jgi:hypothetical protein